MMSTTTRALILCSVLLCLRQLYVDNWLLNTITYKQHGDSMDVAQRALENYELDDFKPTSNDHETKNSMHYISLLKSIMSEQRFNKHSPHLPTASAVRSLYGEKPVIYGLETCANYQRMEKVRNRIAPAGLFNTGTNLLYFLLSHNCDMQIEGADRPDAGILVEVPWGKHTPVNWRNRNFPIRGYRGINHEEVLPIVTVKDPLSWMESMCHHPYSAQWKHSKECPKFYFGKKYPRRYPMGHKLVSVFYNSGHFVRYDTILHLWNNHTTQWFEASFPRIMIRYEDLLFHAEEVVKQVCECGGGKMREGGFQYPRSSAKGEGSGFTTALIKYGNETWRDGILSNEKDVKFVRREINGKLVKAFGYKFP